VGAGHDHHHAHAPATPGGRRWLLGAFVLIAAFMVGEVIAGVLAHSIALITDAGHMLTDALALLLAYVAARIAERPPRAQFTYGFARVDALSGHFNGLTLLLLAGWFVAESVRRLISPPSVHGGVVTVVAMVGVAVNLVATWLAAQADRESLNVRGVIAHLVTDIWAFVATAVAGLVVVVSGWTRADAVASLVVAALMIVTGGRLVRATAYVLLNSAPPGLDPAVMGGKLAAVDGVVEVHDLHVWQLGPRDVAMSAHVLVRDGADCHDVSGALRRVLHDDYGIDHSTVQVDHANALTGEREHCVDPHGDVHVGRSG
jgi:cobalt-zinc-cadmium efflux system protein